MVFHPCSGSSRIGPEWRGGRERAGSVVVVVVVVLAAAAVVVVAAILIGLA